MTCPQCQGPIEPPRRKYCSDKCHNRYTSKRAYHQNRALKTKHSPHPNLRRDYFKDIGTKEKAYWLGFIYADGSVKDTPAFQLQLSAKDENQMDRFIEAIGANPNEKKFYDRGTYGVTSLYIGKIDQDFTKHIIQQGCVPRKTTKIRLPDFQNENLNLAFLMGFFDGDGDESDTTITSGSEEFLQDIKKAFGIEHPVKSAGQTYHSLRLGSDFFIQMLDNYRRSMPRKRKTNGCGIWYDQEMTKRSGNSCALCQKPITDNATQCRKCSGNCPSKRKFDPTPEELERLVWEMPVIKVAERFEVSDAAIHKRCRKYDIEKPPRGYWNSHTY